MKTCGICLKEFPTMWKAKTKTEPQKCKSCAMKNATPMGGYKMTTKTAVEAMVDEINDFNIATFKANNKQYKSIPELIKLATIVFNKWIRKRDTINGKSFVCISCHQIKSVDVMQAGHYLSAGNNSSIRFNSWNVNGQCLGCNCFKDGNQKEYRLGLIDKIGKAAVESLEESANLNYKWDREFLLEVIKKYKL